MFLLIALAATFFSFGFVDGIRWAPAQITFGVSLVLFILNAFAGYTPSEQTRPARGASPTGLPARTSPFTFGRLALLYITLGGLGLIWCGIWFWYLRNHPPESDVAWYWCYGCLFSSLGALLIGLGMGRIFRAARAAVVPPEDTTTVRSEDNQAKVSVPPVPAAGTTSEVSVGRPAQLP